MLNEPHGEGYAEKPSGDQRENRSKFKELLYFVMIKGYLFIYLLQTRTMNMLAKDPMRHKFRLWCDFCKHIIQSGGMLFMK